MIKTFCDNVVGIYTHCESVVAVYTYCDLVWEQGPVPPGQWYVSWDPSNITGSFSMFGVTYSAEDYSGYYSWEGVSSGRITQSAFKNLKSMEYMETNVKYIESNAFLAVSSLQYANMYKCLSVGHQAFNYCKSLETISLPRCRYINSYAFSYCYALQSVNLPKCSIIDSHAFGYCSSISSVYLPVVKSISYNAFRSCLDNKYLYAPQVEFIEGSVFNDNSIENDLDLPVCSWIGGYAFRGNDFSHISLPACETVGNWAFGSCENLLEVYLPVCISNLGAFPYCTSLSMADMPVCEYIGPYCFEGCTALKYVSIPVCSKIGSRAFMGCNHLTSITMPECTYFDRYCFNSCTLLSIVDISGSQYSAVFGYPVIENYVFSDCVNLTALILRHSVVVRLPDMNNLTDPAGPRVFYNTPILSGTGAIYVPSSLYSQYQSIWRYTGIDINVFRSISEP